MISFARFFAAVHPGHTPYPWQRVLAERLASEQTVPNTATPTLTIGVPTGSGKTSVIDALVWALAVQADRPVGERTVGVRIVWAIDRRLLVDAVHDQAQRVADTLALALTDPHHVLHEVAVRLEALKGDMPVDADGAASPLRGTPLVATRWRGGLATPGPAQHPLQAEIITSTVAQIGSRLLFRGYGLGRGSLPVAAALAACDTTICLDEAHLVTPFAETVQAIGDRRLRTGDRLAPATRLIQLSATPQPTGGSSDTAQPSPAPAEDANRIDLTEADVPELGPRLTGPKWASLVPSPGTSDKEQETALVSAINGHVESGRSTIACVVNSVRLARAVFDRIRKVHPRPDADVILLIGPQRPIDRACLLARRLPGDGAPSRNDVLFQGATPPCPLIVVATQTFEVGLDADVEALVTQSASGPAIAQRLGRLNRAGTGVGHATIVQQVGFPLYEQDDEAAWAWLNALPRNETYGIDVSVNALRATPPPLPRSVPRAPELTDATMRALIHTGLRPHTMADPDVEVFLRGVLSEPVSDVSICWRSDLCVDDDSPGADTYREALLRLAPPRAEEQISLSVAAARNLIGVRTGQITSTVSGQRRLTEDVSDVEGDAPPEAPGNIDDPARERRFDGIPFVVQRGRDLLRGRRSGDPRGVGLRLWDLRPGDLIVLPTELGGIDEYGMAVTSLVGSDVAADLRTSESPTTPSSERPPTPIRLTREALNIALADAIPSPGPRSLRIGRILRRTAEIEGRIERSHDAGQLQAAADLLTLLADHPAVSGFTPETVELRRLTPTVPPEWSDPVDDLAGLFLTGRANAPEVDPILDADGDDDLDRSATAVLLDGEDPPMPTSGWVLVPTTSTSHAAVRPRGETPPSLASHAQAVAERTALFARSAGLSADIVRTLTVAARAHDHGKADPRMQAFFRGGVAPPLAELLAKSVFGTADRRADRTARRASGIPDHLRHEQGSVAILEDALAQGQVTELSDLPNQGIVPKLALHAVSVHHGHGRPWPPVPRGGAPGRSFAVDIDGVAGTARGDGREGWGHGTALRRFHRLLAQYGPWSLAYLESMLVLADRTVSAEGR